MSTARRTDEKTDTASVAAFLRANPGWLAAHPEMYRVLAPPARVHGERLADHMAAMLRSERAHADGMVAAGRAAAGLNARVQDAVLALIRAPDPIECVTHEFSHFLAVDSASLCTEEIFAGTRHLPPGTIARLLGTREMVFRERPTDAALLHGEAADLARHDALVRVPSAGPPVLLALASRQANVLETAQGCGALAFLGRALAAALAR
jgi:hypothetical protein